jgi:protoheme IX farnesyltransferase
MVLVAVAVAAFVASWGQLTAWQLFHVLFGTALIAASASAANQWLERGRDALMNRTVHRPLPAGRLRGSTVMAFSVSTLVAGSTYLVATTTWSAAAYGLLTWLLYVAVYTPLKAHSPWNTGVGAVAGAMPVLMGWTAVDGPLGWRAAVLFSILLLWQFPHFMAIAWIYREDYRRAGMRMLTVVEPTGRLAGMHSVLAALALLPVSIAPGLVQRDWGGVLFATSAFAMTFGLLLCSLVFLLTRTDGTARILLRATLIYLPGIFVLLLLTTLL